MNVPETYEVELVSITDLKSHERNYRQHPEDQLEHLVQSLREHGVYRNVVVARDYTILAGHGVVLAAQQIGLDTIPVIRLAVDADDPKALKILIGDNELMRLAEIDDRLLSELLKEIREFDVNELLGTGFDDQMLANLLFVTRPRSEIATFDAAAEWIGLPGYERDSDPYKLVVNFESEEDRVRFIGEIGATVVQRGALQVWSMRWPNEPRDDLSSLRFEES